MFGMLSAYGRPLPDNCRLQFSHHVSMREAAMNSEVAVFVQRQAQHVMADKIARTRMERIERDFSVEFKCDLYVFTPDEFWQIVETAAIELNKSTQR